MPPIPDVINKVPMMYRAQVAGRCQLQRLVPRANEQDAQRWTKEWTERTYPQPPQFGHHVQTRTYQISWRCVTNAGQDDGIIRPVVGARGWPFYPGSSMKGLFRSACNSQQKARYCGRELPDGDMAPGILRFHGGYPTDKKWVEKLLDLVHPQQDYQVKKGSASHAAFMMISLYQPELKFGISSSEPLSDQEWAEIWKIWDKAIAKGLGSRVCAGYGHPSTISGDELYPPHRIHGQGMASKTLGGAEFRPNMFRAAIRGHALRIFGGLVPAHIAEREVDKLFGGLGQREPIVGLVGMKFVADTDKLKINRHGRGRFEVRTYDVTGNLSWLLTRPLPDAQREALKNLILRLNQFAMILGGFGKSWRRIDHPLFFPDYYNLPNNSYIGCHWEWKDNFKRDVQIAGPKHLGQFIDTRLLPAAKEWLRLQGVNPNHQYAQEWREAWHQAKVQVWGRVAQDQDDSIAVKWFHQPYRNGQSIKSTSLTGRLGTIGRIWHRMYPKFTFPRDGAPRPTNEYIEFLTIFPDDSSQ
ncbi:MAG: hypothetical protein Q6K90_03005, partial [Gloeomargarita sp. HHBFW_bins_162]